MNSEYTDVIQKLEQLNIYCDPITDKSSLIKIKNLFSKNEKFEPLNTIECGSMAAYLTYIDENYETAVKYYLMAHELGDCYSLYNLAIHYSKIKDYINAEKYCLMSIEQYLKNTKAMYYLVNYYRYIKINLKNADKYLLMAAENENTDAMYEIASYNMINKNYVDVEKYLIMAIKYGHHESVSLLQYYYEHVEKNLSKILKVYIEHHQIIARWFIIESIKKIWKLSLDSEQYELFTKFLLLFDLQPFDKIPSSLRMFIVVLRKNNLK